MPEKVKIVVFVPVAEANRLRKVMGDAGAGVIGNYSYCTFSTRGTGRFLPQEGAKPAIGNIGKEEEVEEERIEVVCERSKLKDVVRAIKEVHSYEEVALDVYPLEEIAF